MRPSVAYASEVPRPVLYLITRTGGRRYRRTMSTLVGGVQSETHSAGKSRSRRQERGQAETSRPRLTSVSGVVSAFESAWTAPWGVHLTRDIDATPCSKCGAEGAKP